jgi:glycosyltransferase involved in cell wall biosynthesis
MPDNTQQPFLSVIIPCYNEQKNLERGVLEEVNQYLSARAFSWEVIVVNDGSTDESQGLVARYARDRSGFRLLDVSHGGKPAAVWAGIQDANGQVVLFTDMDQSTPIDQLDNLLPWLDEGYDVVIGSRMSEREGTSAIRKLGSNVFLVLRRLFLLRDIVDTQCGFKLLRRQVALQLFPRLEFLRREEEPEGWNVTAFDVELLYLTERAGYRIREVPVRWSNRDESDTKSTSSELTRYLHESKQMAKEVARVKLNERRGMYEWEP